MRSRVLPYSRPGVCLGGVWRRRYRDDGRRGGGATCRRRSGGDHGGDRPRWRPRRRPRRRTSAFGESTDADPALIEKALGPVELTDPIVLASIARAEQDLDEATITTAIECYNSTVGGGEYETGTGGEVVMGYADGGGLNVWRQVTRMEAILQALTYEDIRTIVFRDAQWSTDPRCRSATSTSWWSEGSPSSSATPTGASPSATPSRRPRQPESPTCRTRRDGSGFPSRMARSSPARTILGVVGEDLCSLGGELRRCDQRGSR